MDADVRPWGMDAPAARCSQEKAFLTDTITAARGMDADVRPWGMDAPAARCSQEKAFLTDTITAAVFRPRQT
jgi:hypothetical protein